MQNIIVTIFPGEFSHIQVVELGTVTYINKNYINNEVTAYPMHQEEIAAV